jgi:hypothetical protein
MTIRAIWIGAQLWKRAKKKAAKTDLTLPFCGFLRPWKSIAGVILGTTCADPVFRAELHPHSAFGPATVFLSSKSTYVQIPTPTHKHEPRTAKGQNLLITNHLDQSIYVTNQEQVLEHPYRCSVCDPAH